MTHSTFALVASALGRLFEEPDEDWDAALSIARRLLADTVPPAADSIRRFEEATVHESADMRRERYAGTFDLSPACVPYVSVHLFGDESFKRATLMGAFAEAYRRTGFDPGGELPDHIATILRFVPHLTDEEQQDLIACVLGPAVERMAQPLFGSRNPYRHLLDALRGVVANAVQAEALHA